MKTKSYLALSSSQLAVCTLYISTTSLTLTESVMVEHLVWVWMETKWSVGVSN